MAIIPDHVSHVFSSGSDLFMASLFAYSASVQFNDRDWYFWFPLYASASAVNLLNSRCFFISKASSSTAAQILAKFALGFGVFLFLKVIVSEGCVLYGSADQCNWSLDLSQRVVREKMGSGLVVISMILHLRCSSVANYDPMRRNREKVGSCNVLRMVLLVAVSFGLCLAFIAV